MPQLVSNDGLGMTDLVVAFDPTGQGSFDGGIDHRLRRSRHLRFDRWAHLRFQLRAHVAQGRVAVLQRTGEFRHLDLARCILVGSQLQFFLHFTGLGLVLCVRAGDSLVRVLFYFLNILVLGSYFRRPLGVGVLRFERSFASEVGWEQTVVEGLTADLTFFSKDMDRLVVQNPDLQDADDPLFVNLGEGRVRGLELMVRRAPVGDFFGWLSYTLSRSERNDRPGTAEGEWYPFDFDQTHILIGVAGYKLPRNWGVSGRVQYVTGNPTTPYAGGVYDLDQDFYFGYQTAAYNSDRLPPFVAVDLRVDKKYVFKAWQLEVYLDLLNAVRGENPEFTLYNYDYTDSRYIRGLPFIPSPGFQAEFQF